MPRIPHPSRFDQMDPDLFERIRALATCKAAETIVSYPNAPEFQKAAEAYIAEALASGLPPEHWRLMTNPGPFCRRFTAPLVTVRLRGLSSAKAVEAFAQAGCSFFHSDWSVWSTQPSQDKDHAFLSPEDLVRYVFAGSDSPMRRSTFKILLNDPLTPFVFAEALVEGYERAVSGSSKTSKGVLGPGDKTAKAACSMVAACEAEILKASERERWEGVKAIVADAKERLAAKQEAPAALTPEALKKSLTRDQRERLGALGLLIRKYPRDAGFIAAGLDASPWIKATPNLACVSISSHGSLMAQALEFGSFGALEWLEKAGANPWLASAQVQEPDACSWMANRLDAFEPGDDLSPIARMLLRGAWLDGAPEPKERCVTLASAAVETLCREHDYDAAQPDREKARALLAAMERLTIDELIAPSAPEPSPKPRRSAL